MTDDIALELFPPEYRLSNVAATVYSNRPFPSNLQSYFHLYLYIGHSLTMDIRLDGHVYGTC